VDRFFDEVLVMAEDESLRRNRLALLRAALALFYRVADVSRLGG
jgi:glycyl-tRNA synthetase beta chain